MILLAIFVSPVRRHHPTPVSAGSAFLPAARPAYPAAHRLQDAAQGLTAVRPWAAAQIVAIEFNEVKGVPEGFRRAPAGQCRPPETGGSAVYCKYRACGLRGEYRPPVAVCGLPQIALFRRPGNAGSDRHVDFADAAFFPRGDLLDTGDGPGKHFLEPSPATGDRGDELGAGLRADRANIPGRCGLRHDDLAPPF